MLLPRETKKAAVLDEQPDPFINATGPSDERIKSNVSHVEKHSLKDYQQVYNAIAQALEKDPEYDDGSFGPVVLRLAWHASGTYDKDSKSGGSNYATMRFFPEAQDGANAGLVVARDFLDEIHKQFPWITYGDLWTLGGVAAVQELGGPKIPWRPGRVDGELPDSPPRGRLPDGSKKADHLRFIFHRMGFSDQDIVTLTGAHALGRCHTDRSGFDGPWQYSPTTFNNELYVRLLEEKWNDRKWAGPPQMENEGKNLMMLKTDYSLTEDPAFRPWVEKYAKDEGLFFKEFQKVVSTLFELGVPKEQFEAAGFKKPAELKTLEDQGLLE